MQGWPLSFYGGALRPSHCGVRRDASIGPKAIPFIVYDFEIVPVSFRVRGSVCARDSCFF